MCVCRGVGQVSLVFQRRKEKEWVSGVVEKLP